MNGSVLKDDQPTSMLDRPDRLWVLRNWLAKAILRLAHIIAVNPFLKREIRSIPKRVERKKEQLRRSIETGALSVPDASAYVKDQSSY